MTQAQAPVLVGTELRTRRRRPWGGGRLPVHLAPIALMIIWAIPALGLLVSSFRPASAVANTGWWTALFPPYEFTFSNYEHVLTQQGLGSAFLNSPIITVPATIIVVVVAAFAAYAFSWMDFPGRQVLFVLVVGLLVVPLQVTLVPVLRLFRDFEVAGQTH